ncbi:hypothetical protein ACQPYA_10515 [Micromonospora sp. CA-263727]|uniref:hypothetical protein n=1 Tax=Micromonospora sp. CA-263727 TaxID=3239967 RepID=UPI003D8CA3C0
MDSELWLDGRTAVNMIGYSPWPAERLLSELVAGRRVRDLPGDFVLVASRPGGGPRLIATSVLGIRPYFYLDRPGPAQHGADVFRLARQAQLPWQWNLDALRAVAWFGHTVGTQTLHPRIRRVPPASVLLHDGEHWRVTTDRFWDDAFSAGRIRLDDAVDAFHTVLDEQLAHRPLISLSAGFDSRALLARALATGQTPDVLTMGHERSTDVVVAARIAAAAGLRHSVVQIRPDDYYRHATLIARLTGGTKTIGNWHTFLYCQGRPPHEPHLVGSNGEFARTFFWDKGVVARGTGLGGRLAARAYWAARIGRRARRMAPFLPFLTPNGVRDAVAFSQRSLRPVATSRANGLDVLDRFYATERVRHFIGNGLNLCGHFTLPMSPFLDARVIQAIAALPRTEKLGSNFHRRVIQRNAPALMAYPAGGVAVRPRAEIGYWRRGQRNWVPYSPMKGVYRDPRATEILRDSPHIAEFLSPAGRSQVALAGSTEAKEFLLTLHFAGEAAR